MEVQKVIRLTPLQFIEVNPAELPAVVKLQNEIAEREQQPESEIQCDRPVADGKYMLLEDKGEYIFVYGDLCVYEIHYLLVDTYQKAFSKTATPAGGGYIEIKNGSLSLFDESSEYGAVSNSKALLSAVKDRVLEIYNQQKKALDAEKKRVYG